MFFCHTRGGEGQRRFDICQEKVVFFKASLRKTANKQGCLYICEEFVVSSKKCLVSGQTTNSTETGTWPRACQ